MSEMYAPPDPTVLMDRVVPVLAFRAVMLVLYAVLLEEMMFQPPWAKALS